MKVDVIGGGPGGLYLAILLKLADPRHRITVHERNRVDDPFGFGVVFSDATGHNLAGADPATFREMEKHFARWDDIDIHYRGQVIRSTGHGFSGLSRLWLLRILAGRAQELGVVVRFGCEVQEPAKLDADLVVAADGFNSALRERYADVLRPTLDLRPNRFVWLGTTQPFPAFTFYFKYDRYGLWRVHAYQYEQGQATFIVETSEQTWRAAGLESADESCTLRFCQELFAEELDGHELLANRSVWRQFAAVRNERWWCALDAGTSRLAGDTAEHRAGGSDREASSADRAPSATGREPGRHDPAAGSIERAGARDREAEAGGGYLVLLGDAAHTAHFSIGSGTKMAMEDAITLSAALAEHSDLPAALQAYEAERRPAVESLQRAAQVSMQWFEETERYMRSEPIQFAFNLLTRSLRVTHDNLRLRDPQFVARIDNWFARKAEVQSGRTVPAEAPPPLFTPFRVRDLVLENRVVVSPMCQYSAEDGTPDDWHLVHLGSRAIGGAGLVMAEMTDVSREARITTSCTGLYNPEHVPAWRRIVDFVHRHSYAKIGIQLGHAGRKAATRVPWEGDNEPLETGAWPILAASPIPYFPHSAMPKAMDRSDMDRVLADFVRAAGLAEQAGFDWLELHCAHGYLLASFVSPITNRRTDTYGGSLENRLRYPLEVFDAVRDVWPPHKPMSVRISAVDWVPEGMDSVEAVNVAKAFKEHGCDLVDVSAGQTVPEQRPVYGRLFQTPFSDRIRQEAGIPTMAVGNISSFTDVNTILAAGRADLCLMARAHLWDPYWTRHAAYEMDYPLTWPKPYATLDGYKPRFQ